MARCNNHEALDFEIDPALKSCTMLVHRSTVRFCSSDSPDGPLASEAWVGNVALLVVDSSF